MKNFLIDVPVKINIWIREDCQRRQFEVLKKAKPSILFIQSDGGRTPEEWEAINRSRKMFDEEIDWDCKVFKIYEESNQGMYKTSKKAHELIWANVDRCILLEDDIIPSLSFFSFCAEMFEKYLNDARVFAICGMNHIGINKSCSSDYFFSRYGSVWGLGLWRRSYEEYYNHAFRDDKYIQGLLKEVTKKHPAHWKQFVSISNTGKYDGHVPSTEFYMNSAVYSQHQVFIIPKKNMISNIGCQKNASHGDSLNNLPRGIRRVFNMKTYEIKFPLKDPSYVIPDIPYENKRNKIMALDHPIIRRFRLLERSFLILKNDGASKLISKIKMKKAAEK